MSAAVKMGAAWLAFMVGLLLGGQVTDGGSLVIGAALGAMFVVAGFIAASRARPLDAPDTTEDRVWLATIALAVGIAMGLANLAANWLIAQMDPAIHALLVRRFAALTMRTAVVAAPLTEEVAVRLFLMSAIAWPVFHFTRRASLAFVVALIVSSVVFASLHLARPLPLDTDTANAYRAALMVKYTLSGIPLGWAFWRLGLPYAMLCHAAANAAHIAVEGLVF